MAWTNERLDDFAQRVDARFDEVDRRFDTLDRRFEAVDRRFDAVDRRMDRMEDSIAALGDRVHADIRGLHTLVLRTGAGVGGGIIVALIGVIATVLGTA